MRYLAIGDIHGCYGALTSLLELVGPRDEDRLITLGDYVDRGPDSRAVVDWVIERTEAGSVVPLCGNHEIMMLMARESREALEGWLISGGEATLKSYSPTGTLGKLSDVPQRHWEFLESRLRAWYETETHFFVHANAYPELALGDQPNFMLYWEKFDDPPPHESGKAMVCGHTAQKSGVPRSVGHAVCIDTWVYGDGWLTCLDPATGQYWQARESGETRTDWLEPSP